MKLNERILKVRKDAGLTQQALADAIGVTKGAVSHWESGTSSPREKVLEDIATATNVTKEWLLVGGEHAARQLIYTPNARIIGSVNFDTTKRIPVYGQAVGGENGEFPMNGTILFDVLCPPQLQGVNEAYAIMVSGDSMYPRYRDGEIVYVDPTRRVRKDDFVVAQIAANEYSDLPHGFVKMFCKHNINELVLEQFNPPRKLHFPHSQVVSVHYIAMSGDAL